MDAIRVVSFAPLGLEVLGGSVPEVYTPGYELSPLRGWEHQIRDEADLQNHIDYIHFNPVKHELVESVDDWPWSTYHRFVKMGLYRHRVVDDFDGDFGEGFAG